MPTEAVIDQARADARKVAHRLRDMLARHERGRVRVQAGELTVELNRGAVGWRAAALFTRMACERVAAKYRQVGKSEVAAAIESQGTIAASVIAGDAETRRARRDLPRPCSHLITARRRLGAHCSRVVFGNDPDLHLCDVRSFDAIGYSATPWVFQQEDLRYRWTDAACAKLRFLADCWEAYAGCDFTLADATIGHADFPLSPRLIDGRGDAAHS